MTCLESDKWEVTPYHVWSGVAWSASVLMLVTAMVLQEQRLAWVAILMSAGAATYNICSSVAAAAATQREAFDLGREHERRRAAEDGLRRI